MILSLRNDNTKTFQLRGQEQRNPAGPELPLSCNRASQTHLCSALLAEKHLAEKSPPALSTAHSPAHRDKIISHCPSTSSNTGERVLLLRYSPEQGFFSPLLTSHGISQGKPAALSGLCQLSSTTTETRLKMLWSSVSGVTKVGGGV